ncbi:MAG: phosphatase PAP2 family protein [Thermomicrobiales bacterium]|nr:phosphatase PAP2 family protein [Thermomicrobiales bacterium]
MIGVFGTLSSSHWTALFMGLAAFAAYLFDSVIYIPLAISMAGILAWRWRGRTAFPRPGRRALQEAAICSSVFILYETGRHFVKGTWDEAIANATSLMRFEDMLHLDQERAVQQFLLRNDSLVGFFNDAYSWFFLPVVAGALFWLYITNDDVFRRFRTSLAIASGLALVIIWTYPLAPPRLAPGSDIIGTHAMRGGSHSFVNQYAAMPSLHVGWVALSSVALFVGVKHWMRWFWLFVPTLIMGFTVMATGHHYFVDGLVGSAIGVVPFLVLTWRAAVAKAPDGKVTFASTGFGQAVHAANRELHRSPRLRFTTYSLTLLLTYMIVRQIVDHGFTNYWGYMVAQIALSILAILFISVKFAPEGGLSLVTHGIIVVTTYADTLGTAGHMYDRFVAYDKVTHFLGSAAVATAAGDVLLALRRRGTIDWRPGTIMLSAVAIAMALGLGWEVYEYFGDRLLGTGRHAGAEDTIYDIISDFSGAFVAAALLYWWHFSPMHSHQQPAASKQLVQSQSRDDERRL